MGLLDDLFDRLDADTVWKAGLPIHGVTDVWNRAHRLFNGRSHRQLGDALTTITWIIDEYFEAEKSKYVEHLLEHGGWELSLLPAGTVATEDSVRLLIEDWPEGAADGPPDYPQAWNMRDLDALREAIDGYELDNRDFPAGKQSEYFGVLGVWKMWNAFQIGAKDNRMRVSAIESLLEALDSVCWGEQLSHTKTLREELNRSSKLVEERVKNLISLQASKAAIRRHEENRAMKSQVLDWYAIHKHEYGSKDSAAEAVAGKLVPVTFRTARSWISEAAKRVRSARTL
jgi:hypothetical protein